MGEKRPCCSEWIFLGRTGRSKKKKKICICKDSVTVVRMGLLRRLTVGCCFPWRCKLRSASPHRDERAAVPARELCFPPRHPPPPFIWLPARPHTRVLSQQLLSPVRALTPASSSSTCWMPVWLPKGLTSLRHGPKGQWKGCQLGRHFTAEHQCSPNKQCNGLPATANMQPVISCHASHALDGCC